MIVNAQSTSSGLSAQTLQSNKGVFAKARARRGCALSAARKHAGHDLVAQPKLVVQGGHYVKPDQTQ